MVLLNKNQEEEQAFKHTHQKRNKRTGSWRRRRRRRWWKRQITITHRGHRQHHFSHLEGQGVLFLLPTSNFNTSNIASTPTQDGVCISLSIFLLCDLIFNGFSSVGIYFYWFLLILLRIFYKGLKLDSVIKRWKLLVFSCMSLSLWWGLREDEDHTNLFYIY